MVAVNSLHHGSFEAWSELLVTEFYRDHIVLIEGVSVFRDLVVTIAHMASCPAGGQDFNEEALPESTGPNKPFQRSLGTPIAPNSRQWGPSWSLMVLKVLIVSLGLGRLPLPRL